MSWSPLFNLLRYYVAYRSIFEAWMVSKVRCMWERDVFSIELHCMAMNPLSSPSIKSQGYSPVALGNQKRKVLNRKERILIRSKLVKMLIPPCQYSTLKILRKELKVKFPLICLVVFSWRTVYMRSR